jgi:hypothetical protein
VTYRRPKTEMRLDAKGTPGRLEAIRTRLLGGFEGTVGARTIEEGAWRLRKAANLVKHSSSTVRRWRGSRATGVVRGDQGHVRAAWTLTSAAPPTEAPAGASHRRGRPYNLYP